MANSGYCSKIGRALLGVGCGLTISLPGLPLSVAALLGVVVFSQLTLV